MVVEQVVRRTVELEASVEDVWALLTEPEGLAGWLGEEVELVPEPGTPGRVRPTGGARHRLVVDEVEPGRRFGFTWWPVERPTDASRVTFTLDFTLDADGPRTRLTVVEVPVVRAGGRPCALGLDGDVWADRLLGLELTVLARPCVPA